MKRRGFLALASGLLVPVPEPVKTYFFAPAGGWIEPAFDPTLRRLGEVVFGEAPFPGETEETFRRRLLAKFHQSEAEARRAGREPYSRASLDPNNPTRMIVELGWA